MNKGYIKVVVFLLSLFAYVTNKALASEQFTWGNSANIFSSRAAATRYVYSNFTIPSNWRVKHVRHSNVPIQSNDKSNSAIPSNWRIKHNRRTNAAVIKKFN
ncbi:fam-a protein, fragment [Plasmodium vinckei brucechwatti]|uniref:Fam-a protein n=1 Tax=Plasmodium vinckei brucechwatti TaxID=119398 RepID=A0A6V7RW81_PLAVN|nr:fam-a protein, fragment [Plasmodium vinckei brucechwatti]